LGPSLIIGVTGARLFRGYVVTTTAVTEYTPPASTAAPYPRPAYAWYVVIVLTFVYIFAFIDRQILNLLVGPIRRDLQISDTEMSLLTGFAFALFYTFFGLPLGRIADAGNRRGLIAAGFAMWSLFTAGTGLARNFTQMLIMRMGVGEASLLPAAYSLITDYFPPHRRATAQGIYNIALSLGSGAALFTGGTVIGLTLGQAEWILPVVGPIRFWQLVFFIVGLPGVLLARLMFNVAEPARRGPGAEAKKASLREVLAFAKANRATLICHNVGRMVRRQGGGSVGRRPPHRIGRPARDRRVPQGRRVLRLQQLLPEAGEGMRTSTVRPRPSRRADLCRR
jgi:MFS family permease